MAYSLFDPCGPQLFLAHPVLSPQSPVKTLNITLVKQLLFEMPEDLVYICGRFPMSTYRFVQ